MINRIKEYVKWKLAGDELKELHYLKMDIELLKVYASHIKIVSVAARWLQDKKDYPCQFQAAHGSIDDFRAYLMRLNQGSEELRSYNPTKEKENE